MRILVDIGHPAHVHFFRNAINTWEKRGYNVLLVARDKDITIELLERYGLKYKVLSKIHKKRVGLIFELMLHELRICKIIRNFKPDLIMSIAGIMNVHAAKLFKIPSIVFTDTEHAKLSNKLTFPFADTICTPSCYLDDLGKKQIRYKGYHELSYLHPNRFSPNPDVLKELGLLVGDTFFIVRFVSWGASHDIGQNGFTNQGKKKLIELLKSHGRIIISSESTLPQEFEPYRMPISPTKIDNQDKSKTRKILKPKPKIHKQISS